MGAGYEHLRATALKPFSRADILRLSSHLAQQQDFVFLESSRLTAENHRSFLFLHPLRQLICRSGDDPAFFLAQADQLQQQGFVLAGWLEYEFAYLLEPRLRHFLRNDGRPLAVLGVYEEPLIFDHQSGQCSGGLWPGAEQAVDESFTCAELRTNVCHEDYLRAVQRIQDYLLAGDTYQVNLTLQFEFSLHGSIAALYRALRRSQSVCYSAWLRYQGRDILSFSPELFFRADAAGIRVRPMKGTLRRGRTSTEDSERRQQLHADPKNRSENVMIVDLLRNDLGRLLHASGGGAVSPRALFEVETYESLLQMTSTIDAVPAGAPPLFSQLVAALFPCGSVTGAPKIRTMEIIHELEQQPRGVYCGAIGFSSLKESCFNVPIRTIELDEGRGRMGIGSGIVADSNAAEEWAECLLKARFLTKNEPDFQLIETLLWQPESGFSLLAYHLERLADSACYFHFCCDLDAVRHGLEAAVQQQSTRLRLRLLLHRDGRLDISTSLLAEEPSPAQLPRVIFSEERVDPNDPHRFHKTTRRELYERARSKALKQGCAEVLFSNAAGQVTEGSIANIFVRQKEDGLLLTPPVSCGLLAGTFRRLLLEQGKALERVLTVAEVQTADAVYLANSVRGLFRVALF